MNIQEIVKNPATKFVDVRSAMEFNSGHVKNAMNIPLDQFQFRYKEISGLGDVPVVFYCRSGNRSGQAVGYLQRLGVPQIYNGGGIDEVQYYLN